jgi:prepilin-type N-terminal cleavage/methylation domain-containing protein
MRQSSQAGLTLIEIMAALFVITVSLAAVAALQGSLTAGAYFSRYHASATRLAVQQMEYFRNLSATTTGFARLKSTEVTLCCGASCGCTDVNCSDALAADCSIEDAYTQSDACTSAAVSKNFFDENGSCNLSGALKRTCRIWPDSTDSTGKRWVIQVKTCWSDSPTYPSSPGSGNREHAVIMRTLVHEPSAGAP